MTQSNISGANNSAQLFVQQFYAWYMVLWSEADAKPAPKMSVLDMAIKQHPEYFSRELKNAIAIDDSAQSKSGEIVGLDFDPFFGQELWGNFKVADVHRSGDKYLVDIRNIPNGRPAKETRQADLREVVELARENGHWAVTNVLYPTKNNGKDLLQTLKDIKKDRDKI